MKRNENVHTDDIRKISSKEFAQKNVQLEDKLFSDFLRSDYKAIKEDLPGKTRKQRASYNYIVYIIDTQDAVCIPDQHIKPIVEDKLWKIYEAGYEMALYSIMSRIADYKNDLLEIKNINSRYSDKIVELLFEKDVMNHNELAKELQVTTTNLSNIMKRIRDSKADVLRTERTGLFSNATEVARIYQMLLNGGELDGKRYLSPETCRVFTTTVSRISRRGLGFDKPDRPNPAKSPCAAATPSTVYGHTGFTGTCAWVDPTNGLVYVFLCNRIYPNVWNTKLMKMDIRTRIQEVMYQAVK